MFDNSIGKRLEDDQVDDVINRKKRHAGYDSYNDVNLFDVERKGECWVTGWGETKGETVEVWTRYDFDATSIMF